MGYSIYWNGDMEVRPRLPIKWVRKFNADNTAHNGKTGIEGVYGFDPTKNPWLPLNPSPYFEGQVMVDTFLEADQDRGITVFGAKSAETRDDAEDLRAWIKAIIAHVRQDFPDKNLSFQGSFTWDGDESTDRGTVTIDEDEIRIIPARTIWEERTEGEQVLSWIVQKYEQLVEPHEATPEMIGEWGKWLEETAIPLARKALEMKGESQ